MWHCCIVVVGRRPQRCSIVLAVCCILLYSSHLSLARRTYEGRGRRVHTRPCLLDFLVSCDSFLVVLRVHRRCNSGATIVVTPGSAVKRPDRSMYLYQPDLWRRVRQIWRVPLSTSITCYNVHAVFSDWRKTRRGKNMFGGSAAAAVVSSTAQYS